MKKMTKVIGIAVVLMLLCVACVGAASAAEMTTSLSIDEELGEDTHWIDGDGETKTSVTLTYDTKMYVHITKDGHLIIENDGEDEDYDYYTLELVDQNEETFTGDRISYARVGGATGNEWQQIPVTEDESSYLELTGFETEDQIYIYTDAPGKLMVRYEELPDDGFLMGYGLPENLADKQYDVGKHIPILVDYDAENNVYSVLAGATILRSETIKLHDKVSEDYSNQETTHKKYKAYVDDEPDWSDANDEGKTVAFENGIGESSANVKLSVNTDDRYGMIHFIDENGYCERPLEGDVKLRNGPDGEDCQALSIWVDSGGELNAEQVYDVQVGVNQDTTIIYRDYYVAKGWKGLEVDASLDEYTWTRLDCVLNDVVILTAQQVADRINEVIEEEEGDGNFDVYIRIKTVTEESDEVTMKVGAEYLFSVPSEVVLPDEVDYVAGGDVYMNVTKGFATKKLDLKLMTDAESGTVGDYGPYSNFKLELLGKDYGARMGIDLYEDDTFVTSTKRLYGKNYEESTETKNNILLSYGAGESGEKSTILGYKTIKVPTMAGDYTKKVTFDVETSDLAYEHIVGGMANTDGTVVKDENPDWDGYYIKGEQISEMYSISDTCDLGTLLEGTEITGKFTLGEDMAGKYTITLEYKTDSGGEEDAWEAFASEVYDDAYSGDTLSVTGTLTYDVLENIIRESPNIRINVNKYVPPKVKFEDKDETFAGYDVINGTFSVTGIFEDSEGVEETRSTSFTYTPDEGEMYGTAEFNKTSIDKLIPGNDYTVKWEGDDFSEDDEHIFIDWGEDTEQFVSSGDEYTLTAGEFDAKVYLDMGQG